MPAAARTAAQAEAARRNGARSRGPATPAGKARSSRNALRHGLASARDTLLEGEDASAYEDLLAGLVADLAPATEPEAQLVRRLAVTFWKQARADRLEAKLFAWTDTPKVFHAGKYLPVDAEAAFDLPRFLALQRYQAQLARDTARLLRDLRLLKAASPAETALTQNEPEPAAAAVAVREAAAPNESGPPSPEPPPACTDLKSRNEPEPAPAIRPPSSEPRSHASPPGLLTGTTSSPPRHWAERSPVRHGGHMSAIGLSGPGAALLRHGAGG